MLTIGSNIRFLRERNKLSQKDLAKIAGVTDKAISTWERNINTPRMGAIEKMANYFGVKKSDIIEDKADRRSDDDVWELRDMLHKRPEMKTLLHASQKVTKEDIEKVSALVDSLKKTNPEFGAEE
jgi:transcriptional regulator with XRE-family HTH domain